MAWRRRCGRSPRATSRRSGRWSRGSSRRVADGQFDECDLTLRDLDRIREAFVGQLLGMYHTRIAYPQSTVVDLESRRAAGGGGGGAARRRDAGDLPRAMADRPDGPRSGNRARLGARARPGRRGGPRRGRGAIAGRDRAHPGERCRARDAQRRASGQDRSDRRPVVPAPRAWGVPGASGWHGPGSRHDRRVRLATGSPAGPRRDRHLGRAGDRAGSEARAARPATSVGRRPTSSASSSPTARSTSAAGTMPSRPRKPRRDAPPRASSVLTRPRVDPPPKTGRHGLPPRNLGAGPRGGAGCLPSRQALPGRDRALSCCLRRVG